MSWVDVEQIYEAEIVAPGPVDSENICKVMIGSWGCVSGDQEREHACDFFGFTCRESPNPKNCSSRVIRSVPRSRIHLPIGIKACVEGGDD